MRGSAPGSYPPSSTHPVPPTLGALDHTIFPTMCETGALIFLTSQVRKQAERSRNCSRSRRLFIWPHWILVAALETFRCSVDSLVVGGGQ